MIRRTRSSSGSVAPTERGGAARGGTRDEAATRDRATALADADLWIIDLDGVVWLAGEPIGDVGGAVASLRTRGIRPVFATNNSAPTIAELLARLTRLGIRATGDDLVTSAAAVASLLEPGSSVVALADAGVHEALDARRVRRDDSRGPDGAVVGWTHAFDFDGLATAASAARRADRLLGTNEDPTHPTPGGLLPGSGALLAAVATASGVTPRIAGKPHRPMVDLLRSRFGLGERGGGVVLIGDQPGTDGRLAARLGLPFALVDSGVTAPGTHTFDVDVAVRAPDLCTLVGWVTGSRDGR